MSKAINLYARSLYSSLETEEDKVNAYESLRVLVPAFEDSVNSRFFQNPTVDFNKKLETIEPAFEKIKCQSAVKNFIKILIKNDRTKEFKYVIEAFRKMLDDEFKIARGVIKASGHLNEVDQSKVEQEIKKLTGKKPLLSHEIDESLIGGVEIRVDQLKIDYSIKSQIKKLNEVLTGRVH